MLERNFGPYLTRLVAISSLGRPVQVMFIVEKVTVEKSLPIAFRFYAVILRHNATDIRTNPGLFQEQADLISQYQGSQSYHTCTTKIEYICPYE